MIFTIEFHEKDICLYEATIKYPDFNISQLKEYTPQQAVSYIYSSLFKQGLEHLNPDDLYNIKVSFTEVGLYLKETYLSRKFPLLINAFAYTICEKLKGTEHKKIIHLIRLWDESMRAKLYYRDLKLTELDNFFKFNCLPTASKLEVIYREADVLSGKCDRFEIKYETPEEYHKLIENIQAQIQTNYPK